MLVCVYMCFLASVENELHKCEGRGKRTNWYFTGMLLMGFCDDSISPGATKC